MGKIGFDRQLRVPKPDLLGGFLQVGALKVFERVVATMDVLVEAAAFVGDEDDAFELVILDEKGELLFDRHRFLKGEGVSRKAGGAAGDGDAIVSRQTEALVQELVHLLAIASIAAIDGGSADPLVLKWLGGDKHRRQPRRSCDWFGHLSVILP